MKSLFVVHTQYNLILATGMLQQSEYNDLILFQDFKLTKKLKHQLIKHFNRCLFLPGNYPVPPKTVKEKLSAITRDCNDMKRFMDTSYDRILIVDDMCIQEMFSMKCAAVKNRYVEMAWLEDGGNAYFYNGTISGGMGGSALKRFIRRVFFSARFNIWNFYDLGTVIGTHKLLKKGYFTFPDKARKAFDRQERILITDEEFQRGMKIMFSGDEAEFEENSILIVLDKLEVYGEKLDVVNGCIRSLINTAGGKVYYKYHPRESDYLPALRNCVELDRTIALESYLTNSTTKDVTVIGIKSTALQTAKKMGYRTISLIQQVEDARAVVAFYQSIGIECQ